MRSTASARQGDAVGTTKIRWKTLCCTSSVSANIRGRDAKALTLKVNTHCQLHKNACNFQYEMVIYQLWKIPMKIH